MQSGQIHPEDFTTMSSFAVHFSAYYTEKEIKHMTIIVFKILLI